MRTISPEEGKTLYEILLNHHARSLDPDTPDPAKLNIMLDHLRGLLRDISDGETQENTFKAVGDLIHDEDQKMGAMEDSTRKQEKFSYILGLSKALSIIQKK